MAMAAPTGIPMTEGLLTLAQWLSPAYPIGSFAYSHGLEALVAEGKVTDQHQLAQWLRTVLIDGAGRSDGILISHACRGSAPINEIDAIARAFSGSAERQAETITQGEAFAKVTHDVWGLSLTARCFPVVFGEAVGAQGLPLAPAIALYLQGFASNILSGAIRLGVASQTQTQSLLSDLVPLIETVTSDAMNAELDDLKSAAFIADIAAISHETLQPRIFRT